jgi:rubrerythrin
VNIIDYALQTEKDGEEYYRALAAEANDAGIKKVFEILADAEAEHYRIFKQLKENTPVSRGDEKPITRIKTLFSEMKQRGGQDTISDAQVDAYIKARDIERKSQDTYRQKAEELSDPEQKALCLKIAEEEGKHYIIMDNLIELLQRPATWVEDAEWRNMEDY